jgi:hypothetical protein
MREGQSSILERIGSALQGHYNDVAKQPLPERWVDLINYLNAKERAEREAFGRTSKSPPERSSSS